MVITQFWPLVGGAEVQCQRLAKELVKNHYQVQILTGRWESTTPRYQDLDGVAIFRNKTSIFRNTTILSSVTYSLSLVWELWRRRRTFDILHVHQALRPAYIATILARILRKPIIIKVGSGGITYDLTMLKSGKQSGYLKYLDFFLWQSIRKCDHIVAITREIESQLRQDGFSEKQIVNIPNGIPMSGIVINKKNINCKIKIVTLGRIDGLKGIDTLIKAVSLLDDTTLHIGGKGPLEKEFKSLVKAKRLEDRVFFEGLVNDIRAFFQKADIFVLATRTEGMSNSLLEAMAHRVACIVTPVGGNRDIIQEGVNGLFVPVDNPIALAAALRRVIDNPELRDSLASAGLETVRSKYNMEIVAQRYSKLYGEMINPQHS
jgi:glycosyltransferase involved in cell wall biosynthesis